MKDFFKRDNKFFWVNFGVVVVVLAAVAYALINYFFHDNPGLDKLNKSDRLALKKNIVVLGVDERQEENDVGRSDTLFVIMLDSNSKSASLLSVPRDTRVRIDGYGWDKINHAYAYGGREKTQQTVEELLGIRINNYVMVDFKGFEGLVDAIGGVDLDVEKDMYYYDEWDGFKIDLQKGRQHLDGKTAIQYVRYRDEEGDIGRIRRQQHFLLAVYEKISSADMLLRIPGLAKQLTSMVKTDMRITDMIELGRVMHSMVRDKGIAMSTVPGEPKYIGGVSYWLPDITDLRDQMVKMQGAEMTERYKSAAELMEREYHNALLTEEKSEEDTKSDKKKETVEEKEKQDKKIKTSDKKSTDRDTRKNSDVKSDAAEESKTRSGKGSLVVRLINCSGNEKAYSAACAFLEDAGFTVINGGSGDVAEKTSVTALTNDGAIVNKLSGVPFRHGMRISRDADSDVDGVVILGRDFQ